MSQPPQWNGRGRVLLIIGAIATIISLWIYFEYFTGEIK
jgi:hypothetical protein